MPFNYPVFLDLTGARVLVVGGGRVALRKVHGLLRAGAVVTVVAPEFDPGFDGVHVRRERRAYEVGEVVGYQLVLTAVGDAAVTAQVAADARAAMVWVNSADDPEHCSFILPAVARRGSVSLAVSTGGASPALASRLRTDIANRELTPIVEAAADNLAAQRAAIHAAGGSTEEIDWTPRVDAALASAAMDQVSANDDR